MILPSDKKGSRSRGPARYWRKKQNIVASKKLKEAAQKLSMVFKDLEKTLAKGLAETVLYNELSPYELRLGILDKCFREDVCLIALSKANAMCDNFGSMFPKAIKSNKGLELAVDYLSLLFAEVGWPDINLATGTLISTTAKFGYMPSTCFDKGLVGEMADEDSCAMFLGWKHELISSVVASDLSGGVALNMRGYTQQWLWNEKIYVQNLPITCYSVVKNGTGNLAPEFWDPDLDFS